jgi:hypothetical protein
LVQAIEPYIHCVERDVLYVASARSSGRGVLQRLVCAHVPMHACVMCGLLLFVLFILPVLHPPYMPRDGAYNYTEFGLVGASLTGL